jgi:5-methylcytosine-specific restriction endonuclease McrA
MLYIDPAAPNVFVARQAHHRYVKCFINKRIGASKCNDKNCHICRYYSKKVEKPMPRLINFLNSPSNMDSLISGGPAELAVKNQQLWLALFPNATYQQLLPYIGKLNPSSLAKKPKDFKKRYRMVHTYVDQINEIFDYEWLSDIKSKPYNAYALCKTLDRYTCSYCNRSYTSTIFSKKKEPIVRPTLDHWFPKAEYPALAISFHNLVPSCHPCNSSVKGTVNLSLALNTHPYQDSNQLNDFEFDYRYTANNGFEIFVKDTLSGTADGSRAKNTVEVMHMQEIYNSNISELRDLLILKRNYSTKYVEIMQSLLKTKMTKPEVYRILFGTAYEQENYHKRPLSKFKRDILKKLGMLDNF